MQVLSPHPQRAPGFGHSSEAQASRVGIQRRHRVFSCKSAPLLSRRSKGVVRCSPRLRRCSNATRSVQRRLWPSVQSVGVGHSEPPVKGSRLGSLEPLCPRRMQAPTQKQEAPTSTSEGRVGPSAVGRGSSRPNLAFMLDVNFELVVLLYKTLPNSWPLACPASHCSLAIMAEW